MKIQNLKQQLISRRVRNAIDEVSESVNRIIGKCQENRDSVSDIRELPAKLRQIHEAVLTFNDIASIDDPNDRTRNREVTSTLRGLVKFFGTMEQEMLLGRRVNFNAMQEVMSRMVRRAEHQQIPTMRTLEGNV